MDLPCSTTRTTLAQFLDLQEVVEAGEHRVFKRAITGMLSGDLVTLLIDDKHGHLILRGGQAIGVGDGVAFQGVNEPWEITQ